MAYTHYVKSNKQHKDFVSGAVWGRSGTAWYSEHSLRQSKNIWWLCIQYENPFSRGVAAACTGFIFFCIYSSIKLHFIMNCCLEIWLHFILSLYMLIIEYIYKFSIINLLFICTNFAILLVVFCINNFLFFSGVTNLICSS